MKAVTSTRDVRFWTRTFMQFVVSVLTGIVLFTAIAGVAVFIGFLSDYLVDSSLIPGFVGTALDRTSDLVLGVDILLLLLFLVRTLISTTIEIREHGPGKREP